MRNFSLKNIARLSLVALVGTSVLTACGPRSKETGEVIITATPQKATLNKNIEVSRFTPSVKIDFGTGLDQLSESQALRLDHFLKIQKIRFGSIVEVELPAGQNNSDLASRRYGALGGYLLEKGYDVQPRARADSAKNALRVYVTRYVGVVEQDCQKGWRRPEGTNFENLPLPHMGCSTASTLAAMVANPKDLVEPVAVGGADAERAALAIQKYRSGKSASSAAAAPAK